MPLDSMHHLMNSFKIFERKLDQLQDDMNYQGRALSDLRVMVMNLSTGTIVSPDMETDDNKRASSKTSGLHEEKEKYSTQGTEPKATKRPSGLKYLPMKPKPNSILNQKPRRPAESQIHKIDSNQIHMQRHRKAELNRKGDGFRKPNAVRDRKKKSGSMDVLRE